MDKLCSLIRKDIVFFPAYLAPMISLVLTRQEKFDHVLKLAGRLRDRTSRMLGDYEQMIHRKGGRVIYCLRTKHNFLMKQTEVMMGR
jgi:hypothetical protein